MFVAAFLIVEQFVQNYFSAQFGTLLGAVAAGLMLFGLGPIRRFAESPLPLKLAILPGDAIAVERDVRGERVAAVAA